MFKHCAEVKLQYAWTQMLCSLSVQARVEAGQEAPYPKQLYSLCAVWEEEHSVPWNKIKYKKLI